LKKDFFKTTAPGVKGFFVANQYYFFEEGYTRPTKNAPQIGLEKLEGLNSNAKETMGKKRDDFFSKKPDLGRIKAIISNFISQK